MSDEQKQLIREKFSRQFVELHPIDGTDLFNRPPLYDTPQEQIDKIIDFWLNELDLAIKQTEERIVEVIKESRNVDEQFGVGIKEQQTRNQVIVDILTLIRNK